METLTNNQDTDVVIINSLNLQELRQVCQMNKYAANLCENHIILKNRIKNVKHIVNRVLDLIENRIMGLTLNMNNEEQTFKDFNDLMVSININDGEKEENNENPSSIYNNFIVFNLVIFKYGQSYIFKYYMGEDLYENEDKDITTFTTYDHNKLKEFLLNIYYNNMILVI